MEIGSTSTNSAPPDGSVGPEVASVEPRGAPADPAPRTRKSSGLVLWFRDLLISAFASVLIITFLYQPVRVEGTSMLPRLEDSDRLFINKFVYHFANIDRGDVVVFRYPRDPEKSYIKRVIALPGDQLRIDHGHVYVNGKRLRGDRTSRRNIATAGPWRKSPFPHDAIS